MTGGSRAVIGALFGALLTLLVHPASRPYFISIFHPVSLGQVESAFDTKSARIDPPKDLIGASLWLQIDCMKRKDGPIDPKELQSALWVLDRARERDPRNGFWTQLAAVFTDQIDHKKALQLWREASDLGDWNDYQVQRLSRSVNQLAAVNGAPQSWQLAVAYYERSDACTTVIEQFARSLLSEAELDNPRGVAIRFSTLKNGRLIREKSKSMKDKIHGAEIVELSVYPKDLTNTPGPKKLLLGENTLTNNLRKEHFYAAADQAELTFRNNETWKSWIGEGFEENARTYATASVIAGCLPSVLLLLASAGGATWLFGALVTRSAGFRPRVAAVPAVACSFLLGAAVFLLTWFPLAAAATTLSSLFLTVGPQHARKLKSQDLGPLFSFSIFLVAMCSTGTFLAFLIGITGPAMAIFPVIGVPIENYGPSSIFVGLSVVIFALLFLFAPMWALVQHVGTPYVLGLALRKYGVMLGMGGVILAILLGPMSVYADRLVGSTLKELLENEWLHYYLLR